MTNYISPTFSKWTACFLFVAATFFLTACGGESNHNDILADIPAPVITAINPLSFITKWLIAADNDSITLPLRDGYNYDFTVDWGDGSDIAEITSDTDTDITHTYALAGEYEVTIEGLVEAWYFNNSGSKGQLIEVVSLGDTGWKNLEGAFNGCKNLTSFAGGNTTDVTNMSSMFRRTYELTTIDLGSFDTSNVTNMSSMFRGAASLATINANGWDISNVTANITDIFNGTGSNNATGFTLICDIGGSPGTGSIYTKPCSP